MSGIQLAGLASGVDWTTLITQLVDADRTPETAWKAEQSTIASQVSTFGSLSGQFSDLQTTVTALQDTSLFASHSTSQSNASLGWTTTAGTNTLNGQYSVNVSQLASTASRQGGSNVGKGLSATSDVSGLTLATLPTATAVTAGSFQVNGATVSVSLTDSLQDVFAKVSAATNGAVTASYDPTSDAVTMQSSSGSPVVLGAANDTSNFLSVMKLSNNGTSSVTSAGDLGSTQLNKPLSQSHLAAAIGNTDASGNGSFQVNGVSIAFNVNSDSLQTVLHRINASSAGVTATYDSSNDRFTLSNKTTGNLGLSISEPSGGLLDAMGIGTESSATTINGTDAIYSVNGGANTVSHGNSFTDASSGLSITATSTGTQNVTVNTDSSGATTAINNFIASYNKVQTAIAAETKISVGSDGTVSTALFAGNRDVSGLSTTLRSLAFSAVPSLTGGSISRLEDIGIDFTPGASTLTITDPTKLANALASNSSDVANLFQNSTNGLTTQLNNFITTTTGTTGTIATQTATLNKRTATITDQINALERKLSAEQDSLTAEFTAMEQAEATIKNEGTELTNAFGGGSSSSSSSSSSA